MKKLILLLVLGGLLFAGYQYYYSPDGQDTVEKAKAAKAGYDIVNEKDPAKVLQIIEENEATVKAMVEKGVVTEEQVTEFKGIVREMEASGGEMDKKVLAEKYLKGKVSSPDYQQVLAIAGKEEITLDDIRTVKNLIDNKQ